MNSKQIMDEIITNIEYHSRIEIKSTGSCREAAEQELGEYRQKCQELALNFKPLYNWEDLEKRRTSPSHLSALMKKDDLEEGEIRLIKQVIEKWIDCQAKCEFFKFLIKNNVPEEIAFKAQSVFYIYPDCHDLPEEWQKLVEEKF